MENKKKSPLCWHMQMSWRNMQIRRLLLFFFSLRSNYRKRLRAVLFALCPPSLLPSPSLPHQISSMLISNAILPVLYSPFSFSKHSPPVTGFQLQLLLVSLLSEKSTSLEAFYHNLLQQGGRLKLSGMTCGLDGAGWCWWWGGVNV